MDPSVSFPGLHWLRQDIKITKYLLFSQQGGVIFVTVTILFFIKQCFYNNQFEQLLAKKTPVGRIVQEPRAVLANSHLEESVTIKN